MNYKCYSIPWIIIGIMLLKLICFVFLLFADIGYIYECIGYNNTNEKTSKDISVQYWIN